MKTAGIIGGTSWHSTVDIYRGANAYVAQRLGGYNCAKMVLVNVNLQDIISAKGAENKAAVLVEGARQAQAGGADFIALCSNGLHEYRPFVQAAVELPVLHIADPTVDAIVAAGYSRVAMLGVQRTMEAPFYIDRLRERGLEVFIPDLPDREFMDKVLFGETIFGEVLPESSRRFYDITNELVRRGAQCAILGCTEIGMLMQQEHTDVPLFDTTKIHAENIGRLCIEGTESIRRD
ncbi:MAG: amino acid racemase [Clostridia bacterium]|nr:amino acid racemase [Clostridia bacterium]